MSVLKHSLSFFILFLLSLNLYAFTDLELKIQKLDLDKVRYYQINEKLKSHSWKLLALAEKKKETFLIIDLSSEKTLLEYSPQINTQKFLRASVHEMDESETPIIVTFWTHGAHGEEMVVFQFVEDKFKQTVTKSAWPIRCKYKDKEILCHTTEDSTGSVDSPPETKIVWKPLLNPANDSLSD